MYTLFFFLFLIFTASAGAQQYPFHYTTERLVAFQPCDASAGSNVHRVAIRAADTLMNPQGPPQFHFKRSYEIEVTFKSSIKVQRPRAALEAIELSNEEVKAELGTYVKPKGYSYAYSGQSFDACRYTRCPIRPDVLSTYTYPFRTLHSPFDWLSINVTDGVLGRSVMCIEFPAIFIDNTAEKQSGMPSTTTHPLVDQSW